MNQVQLDHHWGQRLSSLCLFHTTVEVASGILTKNFSICRFVLICRLFDRFWQQLRLHVSFRLI